MSSIRIRKNFKLRKSDKRLIHHRHLFHLSINSNDLYLRYNRETTLLCIRDRRRGVTKKERSVLLGLDLLHMLVLLHLHIFRFSRFPNEVIGFQKNQCQDLHHTGLSVAAEFHRKHILIQTNTF